MENGIRIALIQSIMRGLNQQEIVFVKLNIGEWVEGYITFFDGMQITVSVNSDEKIISITEIKDIEIKPKNENTNQIDSKSFIETSRENKNTDKNVKQSEWRTDETVLKSILERCEAKQIEINEFERALLEGKRELACNMAQNEDELHRLGYDAIEILRIQKGCINANWKSLPHNIGSRVYLMQTNKHGIAQVCYEVALEENDVANPAAKKIYETSVNALAMMLAEDSEAFVTFYEAHEEYCSKNRNFLANYQRIKNGQLSYLQVLMNILSCAPLKQNGELNVSWVDKELNTNQGKYFISQQKKEELKMIGEDISSKKLNDIALGILSDPKDIGLWNQLCLWAKSAYQDRKIGVLSKANQCLNNLAVLYLIQKKMSYARTVYDIIFSQKFLQDFMDWDVNMLKCNPMVCKKMLAFFYRNFNLLSDKTFKNKNATLWSSLQEAFRFADEVNLVKEFEDHFSSVLANPKYDYCKIYSQCFVSNALKGVFDEVAYHYLIQPNMDAIPYRHILTAICDNYMIEGQIHLDGMSEVDKEILRITAINQGNLLTIANWFEYFGQVYLNTKCNLGLDAVLKFHRLLNEHNIVQEDKILYQIEAMFMMCSDKYAYAVSIYEKLYSFLEMEKNDRNMEYYAPRMICGEIYLNRDGDVVQSFMQLVNDTLIQESKKQDILYKCKEYKEFYTNLKVALLENQKDFAECVMRSIFLCEWKEIIEYIAKKDDDGKLQDAFINLGHIVINENEKFSISSDFYRTVLQNIILYTIDHGTIHETSFEYELMHALWKKAGMIHCKFSVFMQFMETVDPMSREELKLIFNLPLEIKTVYDRLLGRTILLQPNCENYVDIISIFARTQHGFGKIDLFEEKYVRDVLEQMNRARAIKLAKAYERLYLMAPVNNRTDKGVSEHNHNIFNKYLEKYEMDYTQPILACERFRAKYEMLCKLNGVSVNNFKNDIYHIVMKEQFPNEFVLKKLRDIYAWRAFYLYYAVCAYGKMPFEEVAENDIVNAISIGSLEPNVAYFTLFEERVGQVYVEKGHIRDYTNIVRLIENGEYVAAYAALEMVDDLTWKKILALKLCTQIGAREYVKDSEVLDTLAKCIQMWGTDEQGALRYGNAQDYPNIFLCKILHIADAKEASVKRESLEPLNVEKENNDKNVEAEASHGGVLHGTVRNVQKELEENIGRLESEMQKECIDWKLFTDTLNLVKEDSLTERQMDSLQTIFMKYVVHYQTLDTLIQNLTEDVKKSLNAFAYNQGMSGLQKQTNKDICKIVEILKNISYQIQLDSTNTKGISSTLGECSKELQSVTSNKLTNYKNRLNLLIQQKLEAISIPVLQIAYRIVKGKIIYKAEEIWTEDTEKSEIRGVVKNIGRTDAVDILLTIDVNGVQKAELMYEMIMPGQIIPFGITVRKEEIEPIESSYDQDAGAGKQGFVWSATATFKKHNEERQYTQQNSGKLYITYQTELPEINEKGAAYFATNTPAEYDKFKGREYEKKKYKELFDPKKTDTRVSSLLVKGLKRMGKSSVIRYYFHEMEKREDLFPIYVDAQLYGHNPRETFINGTFQFIDDLTDLMEFEENKGKYEILCDDDFQMELNEIESWCETLGSDWYVQLHIFFKKLSKILSKKIVFILDEMEMVFYGDGFENESQRTIFREKIRAICQGTYACYVGFIFCGSDRLLLGCIEKDDKSQMYDAFDDKLDVALMSKQDIQQIFADYNKRYSPKFDSDAIDMLYHYMKGMPTYTNEVARTILDGIYRQNVRRSEIHPIDVVERVMQMLDKEIQDNHTRYIGDMLSNRHITILKTIAEFCVTSRTYVSLSVLYETIKTEVERGKNVEGFEAFTYEKLKEDMRVLEQMYYIKKEHEKNGEMEYGFTMEYYRLHFRSSNEKLIFQNVKKQ